ncbi:4'-phosphopantetheinyl transferase family protein [Flavobacterium luteum]|uniref:4-phosphopantetheinyl transferase family protein n=1 Tax=Flavobacterium luteum TaxID=2026654 RepID=A0A7J5AJW5_9FLAO|nr:4'-phosphopantetheinyl transferase superfamily protein [Flavobacterium luteum]KAB1157901.1 4-phosphopantetheinyl transferase family protein [Flavobacterium luteum]
MIGNDIVDLTLARKESNWKREGFLDKIFTTKEQILIHKSKNQEIMIWDLWSRKEAAYKIYNRKTGFRAFIPLQLECFQIAKHIGKVVCYDYCFYTKTQITTKYVHSIAVNEISDFKRILFLYSRKGIIKKNGIPVIHGNNNSISISNHGNFEEIVMLCKENLQS